MASKIYIKNLKLRGFKSFRSAEATFPKGFVCLAGPNGSGKSNVSDGIRFALGEGSLRALHTKKVAGFVNTSCKLAEVTLFIDGERQLEVRRAIDSEGKTLHELNGKRINHAKFIEELRQHGLEIDIITQSEVQKIVEMEPNELRQMVEEVADIGEFDSKNEEAKLELCRIERRITEAKILLGEREANLSMLERDKNDALAYTGAQTNFRSAKVSMANAEYLKFNKKNREMVALGAKRQIIKQRLSDLKEEIDQYSGVPTIDASRAVLEALARKSQAIMEALGQVNMRAPELYEQKKKDTDKLKSSIASLGAEQKSLLSTMEKTEAKKRAAFLSTFNAVSENFKKFSSYVFPGEGVMRLEYPSDPFNSGLAVRLREGSHERFPDDLPGGEKPLLAVIFIFAVHMCKAAPFYLLDEADSALDKETSLRLAKLIRKLAEDRQFIVITHNDALISNADVALGVMKTKDGSKIVGIKLVGKR